MLLEAFAEFWDKPPGSIDLYMIHLPRAVEREGCIKALETAVGPLERFDAYTGHPTPCVEPGKIRTAGEAGCLRSHVEAMRRAISRGKSHLVVFEDDCMAAGGDVRAYLKAAKEFMREFSLPQDLILLGTCGCYTWRFLRGGVKATDHFNGSHSYSISRAMMEKVISAYEFLSGRGVMLPIDGLLGHILRSERRWALCPENEVGLFVQNRDIPSYILTDGEGLRRE